MASYFRKIKKDESIKEAFWRQANEKIGTEPLRIFKIDYVSSFYDDYYDTVMMVPVAACEISRNIEIQISDLHVDYKWVSKEEIEDFLIWPNQKNCIDLIFKMLQSRISTFHELKRIKE